MNWQVKDKVGIHLVSNMKTSLSNGFDSSHFSGYGL